MQFGLTVLPKELSESVSATVRVTKQAEDLGFTECWIGDSQGIWQELYVTLTVCAMQTNRMLLGPGVTNPLTRHPAVTARALATLHELAPGRVLCGIGAGDTSLTHLGLPPVKMKVMEDAIRCLRDLFRGEASSYLGHDVPALSNYSPKDIKIYLAAFGPKMLQLAGRVADGVVASVGMTRELIAYVQENIAIGAKAAGRNPAEVEAIFQFGVAIDDDARAAKTLVKAHVARKVTLPIPRQLTGFTEADVERFRQAYDYRHHLAVQGKHEEMVPDEWVDRFALAGEPDECVERLEVFRSMGIERLLIVPQMPDSATCIERLAEHVMPHFAA
jgi:5,10-methylenetetrahydromethanopterin reductase